MKVIRGRTRRWWRTLRWRMYRVENNLLSWVYFRWLRGGIDPGNPAWLSGLSEMVWTRLCGHGWPYAAKHGGIYWGVYTFESRYNKADERLGWHWPAKSLTTRQGGE